MSSHPFLRQIALAALAAALWPAAWIVLSPVLGRAGALEAHLLVAAACHVALLAGDGRRRSAFVLVLVLGGAALALAPGMRDGLLGLVATLGACRELVSHAGAAPGSRAPGRTLAREALLLAGGLLLARAAAGPGLVGEALAIWAFGLVQSAWPLVAGHAPRGRRAAGGADPFERSRAALRALVGEGGGGRG